MGVAVVLGSGQRTGEALQREQQLRDLVADRRWESGAKAVAFISYLNVAQQIVLRSVQL